MTRQFAYLSNDHALFDLAIATCGKSLTARADEDGFDGWGLGYYQGDRPLVRKRPATLGGEVDLTDFATDVQSQCVLAHVRMATHGTASPENTQPFRFRNWLFSHVGVVDGEAAIQKLHEELPDFLKRNVRGETDSEVALYYFFDSLRQHATVDRAIVPTDALFKSIREALTQVRSVVDSDKIPELDFLYTSGRMMVAANHSKSRLAWRRIEGLSKEEAPLFAGHQPKTVEYPHFRAIFVTFDPNEDPDVEWEYVDPHSLLVVDEKLEVHVEPINGEDG